MEVKEKHINIRKEALTFFCVIIVMCVICFSMYSFPLNAKDSHQEFFTALGAIESGNNDEAVGSYGEIGRYQITELYWEDAYNTGELEGTFEQCKDQEYSEKVIALYMGIYAKEAWENQNYFKVARIHNGGPNGFFKSKTYSYATRVISLIDAEN